MLACGFFTTLTRAPVAIILTLPMPTCLCVSSSVRSVICLFYAIATAFLSQNLGADMMYEVRRRKPKSTLLATQGIFNLPHHVGTVLEELAFDDAVSYTQQGNKLQHSYILWQWQDSYPCRHTVAMVLTNQACPSTVKRCFTPQRTTREK